MTIPFDLLAGITGIAGYIPYIRDTVRGSTQPDRVSWFIWLVEYSVLFAAHIAEGAHNSLWLIGLQLLGVSIISGLSVRYGTGGFDRNKLLLIACVLASLIVWRSLQSASLAILLLIAVEASGVVITSLKVFRNPGSETLSMWAAVGLGGLLSTLGAGSNAAWIMYVYPVSLIVMSGSVIAGSYLGNRQLRLQVVTAARPSRASALEV
jgi:hypothetical protein